jgi:hypothetical protein
MATAQVDNIVAIAVDRGMRELLRNCLRSEAYQLENFEGAVRGSDREAAHQALAYAVHVVEMFDQLGWEDDDPRERYEITVALDSFVPCLQGYRGDLARSLAEEMTCLRLIAARDEANASNSPTQQEMMAMTHDDVLGWRRELEAIEALLERLDSASLSRRL